MGSRKESVPPKDCWLSFYPSQAKASNVSMEAQNVTHCILLCILASFLYVPHFLQRSVKISRKEILGIVQQFGEEFGVGFGGSISHSFKSLFQRKRSDGRKSCKLGVKAPGFWVELRCTLSDHTPPSNSVYLWFKLPMFNPALQRMPLVECVRESLLGLLVL